MNEVIIPALLSGASSAFTECAINAIVGFFSKKSSAKKTETSHTEIRRFVDDYLKKQYPTLVDYRYINDKLYEFIIDYIKYLQPQINVQGNVIINLILTDNGVENSVSSFLELPENKKWSEIKLLTNEESSSVSNPNMSEKSINSLQLRAQKVGLQLDISDDCNSEKIDELIRIIEKYELLYKRGSER